MPAQNESEETRNEKERRVENGMKLENFIQFIIQIHIQKIYYR